MNKETAQTIVEIIRCHMDNIRKEMQWDLEEDVKVELGTLRYDSTGGNLHIKFTTAKPGQGHLDPIEIKAAQDWDKKLVTVPKLYFNVQRDALGKEFIHKGTVHRVAGLLPRGKKYPVLIKEVGTGKLLKFSTELACSYFPKTK